MKFGAPSAGPAAAPAPHVQADSKHAHSPTSLVGHVRHFRRKAAATRPMRASLSLEHFGAIWQPEIIARYYHFAH